MKTPRENCITRREKMSTPKNDPPFFYIEGKGWYINCMVTTKYGRVHVRKAFYGTKSEARLDYPKQVASASERARRKALGIEVDTWEEFEEAYKEIRLTEVRESSYYTWARNCQTKHFDPLFKGMKVSKVFTQKEMARLMRYVSRDSCPNKTKNRSIGEMKKMIEVAYSRIGCINGEARDECNRALWKITAPETVSPTKHEKKALTRSQVDSLLSVINRDSMDYPMILLLATTGMRHGEMACLTLGDFDFGKMEVRITKTIQKTGEGYKVGREPKTDKSKRSIPLRQDVCEVIERYALLWHKGEGDYLFLTSLGTFQAYDVLNGHLKRYCKEAGVPEITCHELRHTFATLLSEQTSSDFDREQVATILGHSVAIDQDLYARHADKAKQRELVERA